MSLPLRSTAVVLAVVGALALFATPADAITEDQAATPAGARGHAMMKLSEWVTGDLSSAEDKDVFRFRVHGRRTVLITLGDLAADYGLAVYRRDGRLVAAADSPGTGFEQLAPRLRDGEYYVQVAAARGTVVPGRPYRLMVRPLPDTLVALDSHRERRGDMTVVTGQLLNNAARWLERPTVTVRFYDRRGRLLATASALAERVVLAPGERAAFRVVTAPVPRAVRHVVRVSARRAAAQRPPLLTVSTDTPYEVSGGRTRYVGRVRATGPGEGVRVHVHVLRYNGFGALVDYGHALLPAVTERPSPYEIELPRYPYSTSTRVAVTVE